jgi:hypothetical protein
MGDTVTSMQDKITGYIAICANDVDQWEITQPFVVQ